jgi:hypothetical protein
MNCINNISIEKIKKWFEKISRGKPSYGKNGIKPKRDWGVIIVITAIVFCLEATLSAFVYFQIENDSWFRQPQNTTLTEVSINQNLLEKISGQIDQKNATYNATSTPKTISDPLL